MRTANLLAAASTSNLAVDCPVAAIISPLDIAASAHDAGDGPSYFAVDALRMLASQHRATSLDGAALQIAAAMGIGDSIRNASSEAGAESEERRLERTLYSVLGFLQAQGATLPADLREYLATERMDPFRKAEAAPAVRKAA